MKQLILLVLHVHILLTSLIKSVNAVALPDPDSSGLDMCSFNGRFYEIGEIFHPVVNIQGQEYEAVCSNCTCQPTTIAQCEEIQCPEINCSVPITLKGTCCPICLTPDVDVMGSKQCVYEGLIIPHGEVFHPPSMMQTFSKEMKEKNGSALNISVNPFCMRCECTNGEVVCTDTSSLCPPMTCDQSQVILIDGNCCMECPLPPPTSTPKEACLDFDGVTYNHGDSWHPLYPGFGRVDCITCTCMDGITQCAKDPCPEVPFCEPGEPVPNLVLCCLKCKPRTYSHPPTNSEAVSSTSAPIEASTTPQLAPPVLIHSENNGYIINIFKHSTNDSLAVENIETSMVDIYSWSPDSNMGMLVKNVITSDNFRQQDDYNFFKFVGKTLLRRVDGLTTRESKRRRIQECTRDCSTVVINMLRPVNSAEQYAREETD